MKSLNLKDKNILLGICGGIAAYKIPFLVRILIKSGANVRVVMTASSKQFVTKESLSVLSKHTVVDSFFDNESDWNSHVKLGLWADLFLIAPATATSISKMAIGLADNQLIATYLSARCPVVISPAMDLDMWKNTGVQVSLEQLKQSGVQVILPNSGELASGLIGEGRMPEPEELALVIKEYFTSKSKLKGKKILITAGPTYEAIDPVRFIGNRSSGKMGYAIAQEAVSRGAEVVLVSGPSNETPPIGVHTISIQSADEMLHEVQDLYADTDVVIATAAVADYKVKSIADQKIKKSNPELQLDLIKNPDILGWCGQNKKSHVLVGFALETENEEFFAKEKLSKKNLDMIVLNSLKDKGAGFGVDTNRIRIFDKLGQKKEYETKSKSDVSVDILDYLEKSI